MEPEGRLPEELQRIAARLQAERVQADPLELDQIKRRVMARGSVPRGPWTSVKSRFATIGTLVALVGGTGGAIAIGEAASHGGPQGGAASGQYCGHKKCPPPPRCHHHGKCHRHRGPDAAIANRYAKKVAKKAAEPYRHKGHHAYNQAFNKAYNPAFNYAFNQAWLKQHQG